MHHLHQMENQRQNLHQINPSSKATVKKQFSHPFIRFNQIGDKQNQYSQSNLLANLNKNTVRKQNQDTTIQYCANHSDRQSEYLVKIEGQILKYCRKCATHIASQGFDVHKIGSPKRKLNKNNRLPNNILENLSNEQFLSNISPNRGRQSNSAKERLEKQRRLQLLTLIKSLKGLREDYRVKQQSLTEISETFSNQKQMLNSYYNELISYIQEIREIHFQAIDESAVNSVQVCDIQKGQIQETLGQIEEMLTDVEGNFESIIKQVDEQNYAQCFEFYKQKECILSHRLQQLGTEAKPWPCSTEQEISSKIQTFKNFVNQLHQVGDQPNQNQRQSLQSLYY